MCGTSYCFSQLNAALVNPTVVTVPATPLSHSSGECEYIPIAYLTPPSEWPFGTPRIVRL
jgi:hypothetical protein